MPSALHLLHDALLCYFELNTMALTDKGPMACALHDDMTLCFMHSLRLLLRRQPYVSHSVSGASNFRGEIDPPIYLLVLR